MAIPNLPIGGQHVTHDATCSSPRLSRLAKKLVLSLASLTVAVIAAELWCRALEPGPFALMDRNPYVDSPVDKHVRHRADFEGRWDGTWYGTDRRGLRGPDREPTFAEGELRVVCVGDSCTFGKGVREEDSWPRQLESVLREEDRDVLVFNLGINGASGRTYQALVEEHAGELRPDVVIVGYNLNDFPNTIQAVDVKVFKERSLRRCVPQGVRDALGRLALYRKARQVYYDARKARDWKAAEATALRAEKPALDPSVWEQQREYLAAIDALARRHGARTLVLLFPYESQVFLESYDLEPVERLGAVCSELGLPFVDLAAEFRAVARSTDPPAGLFLAGDRYHPNANGYAIVAARVRASLRQAIEE